ncbi:hypothetical protein LCGC14_3052350 [marine sediment metagenome]|uniref:Uncharacterized protein n=1 Tax=marine sediment metagenome TaxID=412755 RepID=A0A0F8X9I4_9ZZZZ
MQVTKTIIPANSELARGIVIAKNFRAYAYNLKKRLAYYREWQKSYNDNPCDTFKLCLDNARHMALNEVASLHRLISNMPEYVNHPDFIKANSIAESIKALA